MNLIQIPPGAAMCPGRPELPQHTSPRNSHPPPSFPACLAVTHGPACHIPLTLDVSVFVCIRNAMFEERGILGVNHLEARECQSAAPLVESSFAGT